MQSTTATYPGIYNATAGIGLNSRKQKAEGGYSKKGNKGGRKTIEEM